MGKKEGGGGESNIQIGERIGSKGIEALQKTVSFLRNIHTGSRWFFYHPKRVIKKIYNNNHGLKYPLPICLQSFVFLVQKLLKRNKRLLIERWESFVLLMILGLAGSKSPRKTYIPQNFQNIFCTLSPFLSCLIVLSANFLHVFLYRFIMAWPDICNTLSGYHFRRTEWAWMRFCPILNSKFHIVRLNLETQEEEVESK